MQSLQSELLAALQAKACVAAAPCKWAAGEGMRELLAQAKQGADKEAATLMDSAAFISGPLLSWEQQLEAIIDQTRCVALPPAVLSGCRCCPCAVGAAAGMCAPADGCCGARKRLHAMRLARQAELSLASLPNFRVHACWRIPHLCRLKESRPMLQRGLDDALVPERQQNKKGGAKASRSASLPPAPADPAGKAAHAALGGQCLYVSTVSQRAGGFGWVGVRGSRPGCSPLAGCRSGLCWQWQQCSCLTCPPACPPCTGPPACPACRAGGCMKCATSTTSPSST